MVIMIMGWENVWMWRLGDFTVLSLIVCNRDFFFFSNVVSGRRGRSLFGVSFQSSEINSCERLAGCVEMGKMERHR